MNTYIVYTNSQTEYTKSKKQKMREKKKRKGKPFKWSTTIFHSYQFQNVCHFIWTAECIIKCARFDVSMHEPIFRSISEQYEMRAKCELHPNCNII